MYFIYMDSYICACIYTHTHTYTSYSMGAVIVQQKNDELEVKRLGF